MVTTMIKDHIPDPQRMADHPELLTTHEDDTVHIVWLQEADHSGTVPHWAYANIVQTKAEKHYKLTTIQALVDQHTRCKTETNRLLDYMEQKSHAYHSTSCENISEITTLVNHHLEATIELNAILQQKIDDHQTARDNYELPRPGSST